MIRVTVEIVPFGREDAKRVIGTAEIVNDNSGDREFGNYNSVVNDAFGDPLHNVRVEKFPRLELDSWDLLYRVLKKAYGGKKPKNGMTKGEKELFAKLVELGI